MFRTKTPRFQKWIVSLVLLGLLATPFLAQTKPEFKKENRSEVIGAILQELARSEGAKTSMADSGSGKITSDMDVTCKFVLVRPDGTKDFDLTPRFIETARRLFPNGDFALDEYGSIQSKILDTAVHDAKNAVPDFHSSLPLAEFRANFMDALRKKLNNPDAYFTAGGNRKQVDQRMQSKSRLRIFDADGKAAEVTVDKAQGDAYLEAMKSYFDMNPEEVMSRKRGPDLFGDSFDAFRQATLHDHGDDLTRGDAKYNTRIINNYLELAGLPGNWEKLPPGQKTSVVAKLFPGADQAESRARMVGLLDESFKVYNARGTDAVPQVENLAEFKEISAAFQKATIAASAAARIKDILDPRISLQDVYDHAQALAQEQGKSWMSMSLEERRAVFEQAKTYKSEILSKLKFAAAGEMAMAFKFLESTDSNRVVGIKQEILAALPEAQRKYVDLQMRIAEAYLRDSSNRARNVDDEMSHTKGVIDEIKQNNLVSPEALREARAGKEGGWSFRKILRFPGATYAAYQKIQEDWETVKNNLDPTAQKMAGTLDKLDKAQAILNLIKVYKDNPNDSEALKKAVYMELASRYVPGYGYVQMLKQWQSGDPAAREEVAKSLVFQGLTMLPGGALAQTVKLGFDVAKTGLEITLGSELSSMGDENVRRWLEGGQRDSILRDVPGASPEDQRKNFFAFMTRSGAESGPLSAAYKSMLRIKRHWDDLPPYKKADKEEQGRYQRKLDAFFDLVRRRVEERVDGYIEGNALAGTTATGSRGKMIELLFADFANGINRELGGNALRIAEAAAAKEAGVLDSIDDYMYGLFSGGLDAVEDAYVKMGLRPAPVRDGRWSIRCSEVHETGEEIQAAAQVVSPLDPTFEEQSTIYHLKIVDEKIEAFPEPNAAPEEIPRRFKITIQFELADSRTGKILASKIFEYIRKPAEDTLGIAHYEEYYNSDPKLGKSEEFDFSLSTAAQFNAKASQAYGRPPSEEEKRAGEEANARMVMNLDAGRLLVGLRTLTAGDNSKAEELLKRIGSGELWILYQGKYIRYNPNGKKDYQREFSDGLAEGEQIKYQENEKIKEKGRIEHNLQTGEWVEFDAAERPIKTTFYEKGQAVWTYRKGYYPNGKLSEDGPRLVRGPDSSYPNVSDGPFISYYENGNLRARGQYIKDRKVGTWEEQYEAGGLAIKSVYGEADDFDKAVFVTTFDRKGVLLEEGAYDGRGRKQGVWTEMDGNKAWSVEYDHGREKKRTRK
jgi:antitoxin component YwqK of YwqJK toxin-antitoxin module